LNMLYTLLVQITAASRGLKAVALVARYPPKLAPSSAIHEVSMYDTSSLL
jgi:hypothetical protein